MKLSIFEVLVPALVLLHKAEPLCRFLKTEIIYAKENSVATTLANEWALS
jgi:hypothetical protein